MSGIDGLQRRLDRIVTHYEEQLQRKRRGNLLYEVDLSVLSLEDQAAWHDFTSAISDRVKVTDSGGINMSELTDEELQELKRWALKLGGKAA